MKNKKLLLISFIFILIFCSCQKSTTTPIDEFDIELSDGNAIISGYHGSNVDIIIPSQTKERQITEIGKDAFMSYDLKSLVISEGITTIGERAFYKCAQLESVKLPNTLETILDYAFANCENLKEIHIPENVKNLSEHSIGYRKYTNVDPLKYEITIYGKAGSKAEEYAKKNNFTFILE